MGWTIRFWDIETGDLLADVLLDNFTLGDGLVLLFDGELMIIGDMVIHGPCSEATTRLSHVKHWKEWVVGRVACRTPYKPALFSRNGRFVATNDYDLRRIAIHDLGVIDWSKPSADTIRSDFPIFIAKLFQTIDLDTEEYAWPGAFSSDGSRLVMRTREGMTIWDVMTGKRVSTFPAGMPAAFSPDGTRIATGGRFLKVWNADSGLPAFIFTERGAAFVGGMGWISRKWYSALDRSRDIAEGTRVIKPAWHFAVKAVAFSCDGTLIAAPAGDKLRIINASTAQLLATLEIGAEQESCTFSVNGARIVLRRGNYVQVWEP
jgi:WD40 repeat protein